MYGSLWLIARSTAVAMCCWLALTNKGVTDEPTVDQFRFSSDQPLLTIPVSVDGQPLTFVLDTGSDYTLLSDKFKHVLGDSIRNAKVGFDEQVIAIYKCPELKVGRSFSARPREIGCVDLSAYADAAGQRIDGILGADTLSRFSLDIDFDNNTLSLGPSGMKPNWSGADCEIQGHPIKPSNRCVLSGRNARFVIDTGDNSNGCIHSAVFDVGILEKSVEPCGGMRVVGTLGNERSVYLGRIQQFRFAGDEHHDLVFRRDSSLSLGLGFLRRYHIFLDIGEGKMRVAPGKLATLRDQGDRAGIRLDIPNKVIQVYNGSTGMRSGVKIGDQLVSINDVPLAGRSGGQVMALLAAPRDETMVLVVKRNGKEQTIRVPAK